VDGARLAVYGLDPDWARSHLRRTGTPEPDSLELPGMVPATVFRAALRRAHVFVHGARWEDWGQAPLEALADGALLATVPAGGPYEGLRLARHLDERLVAERIDPAALAPAIRAAFDMPADDVPAYRERATGLLAPYRSGNVQEIVARDLLPALFADAPR
jgi:glycosyltransferase involved in cell wall biosynthesis